MLLIFQPEKKNADKKREASRIWHCMTEQWLKKYLEKDNLVLAVQWDKVLGLLVAMHKDSYFMVCAFQICGVEQRSVFKQQYQCYPQQCNFTL